MEQKRYSRQRELIYNWLKSTDAHPTAETIYQALKPDHPKLSLGTVYRNLNQLADAGVIVRMPFHVERYDADTEPHAHCCCDVCGQVYDLPLPDDRADLRQISVDTGFSVRKETRLFFGACAACAQGSEQTV